MDLEYYNYTDTGITSGKTPLYSHLLIEDAGGDLYMVDDGDPNNIWKSTDSGDNWSQPNGDFARADNVWSFWHDRTNSKLYFCDLDGVAYITLSTDVITDLGVPDVTGEGYDSGEPWDIFIISGSLYCMMYSLDIGVKSGFIIYKWVDPNWVAQDQVDEGAVNTLSFSFVVVVGTNAWFVKWDSTNDTAYIYKFDSTVPSITEMDTQGNREAPTLNQAATAYDGSDLIYFICENTGDSEDYLHSYSITDDAITTHGIFDVSLMLDRNTASGVMEKAFHLTNYEVYQLHSVIPFQLHLIATPALSGVIVGITDNFLIETGGEVWEYEDVSSYVLSCTIEYEDMEIPQAYIELADDYPLAENMLIRIIDMFSDSAGSSSQIIYEGFVSDYSNMLIQSARLISPAIELMDIFPSGDYSGRTDQIISDLCDDYTNYVTAGTMSNGTAMGTITFYGDKSMREILDDFALIDGFTWYLTPTGAIDYNNGSVDSTINIAETDTINHVRLEYGAPAINYVDIKGAFIGGSQVSGTVQQSTNTQQRKGKNPYERTISFLDTSALCTTANTNVLARYDTQAEIITFDHQDSTVGPIQVGETITFQYDTNLPAISSSQYGIRTISYNPRTKISSIAISDILS